MRSAPVGGILTLTALAIVGLLFELLHDTNDIALGALASIATMGMQALKDRLGGQDRHGGE